MLNMNKYVRVTELFKHGFSFGLGQIAVNIYNGGQVRGLLNFFNVHSSGTGHLPFTLFDLSFITGHAWAVQLTLCGVFVGTRTVANIDAEGTLAGADKRTVYCGFSCLNKPSTKQEI